MEHNDIKSSNGGSCSNKDLQDIAYKSPNSIDQILSKELTQLSLKDRSKIEEEVHGIGTLSPKETPALLEASLNELSMELCRLPRDSKAAFLESQVLPRTYVNTPDFRLRFLRCELLDAKKAALRMVQFLDFGVQLFGPIVLQRPMQMNDLTHQEKKWMQNFQILPYRDQTGRAVKTWVGDFALDQIPPLSVWKVSLYGMYCMSDDIETQRKGCVGVAWVGANHRTPPIAWEHFGYRCKYFEANPLRHVAFHFCMPSIDRFHPIHVLRAAVAFSLGKSMSRIKFHFGNRVELLYRLKSYGIPVDYIPLTESGSIKTIYFKLWMKTQNHLEKAREKGSNGALSVFLLPRSKDVVFRGGTSLNLHPGNVMFDGMIEAKLEEHSCASTSGKAAIVKLLIGNVYQSGGKFLIWNKSCGWWNEIKDVSDVHVRIAEKIRRTRGKRYALQKMCRSSTTIFQKQDDLKRRKLSSCGSNKKEKCSYFF